MKPFYGAYLGALRGRLERLYGAAAERCFERLQAMVGRYGVGLPPIPEPARLTEKDAFLIAYGDMVRSPGEPALATLRGFLDRYAHGVFSGLHLLPFFPYSSDDGFSVIDYRRVNPDLGTWANVEKLGEDYRLVFDLVLNHCSRQSKWFRDYVAGVMPERFYFIEAEPGTDLSAVVRPRATPLLSRTQTRDGERYVWTTFSEDQVDLNFANPDVLFEFLDILFMHIARGARVIRLDAIAYLWKEVGTPCIHLPQTHEVVKLLRDIVDLLAPHVLLLTETNVPHEENVSYFGDGDEAHMVYQFPLPPLLLHALQGGSSRFLTEWAASLPDLPPGQAFLNFTASHDGIGVRPLEGTVPREEFERVVASAEERGGHVSTKTNPDGSESPYELNITYFDALRDPEDSDDSLAVARFLCSQIVSMSLRGVPAIYFNSLVGARNWTAGVRETNRARTINRRKWDRAALGEALADPSSAAVRIMSELTRVLGVRARRPAFHPEGKQRALYLRDDVFAIERISPDGSETVVSVSNFTSRRVSLSLGRRVPILNSAKSIRNLLKGSRLTNETRTVSLAPYETAWLTPNGP